MQAWSRIRYTFGLVVVAAFVVALIDMLLSLDLADMLFSPPVVVPAFVVAWLVAPYLAARMRFK